ncbi:MAG: phytanoyl-CoA dioxygenase family protein [Burkholderiaceae bacterium]
MINLFAVPAQARAEYAEHGATVLRSAVSAEWVELLRAAIERDIESPGPYFHGYKPSDGQGRFHGNLRLWQHDEIFREFCLESYLPTIAQQFFEGGQVNLLYDQLFVKEPGTKNRTRWHNDQPYWPISGKQVISLWIALDPVRKNSGALEFISGSNRWDRWFQPRQFGETETIGYDINPDYEEIPDIESNRDDYQLLSWDLNPGDCYVFNGMTVHGAGGNTDLQLRRRGYTIRYTGDDVRYDPRVGTSAPLHNSQLAPGDKLDSEMFPLIIAN